MKASTQRKIFRWAHLLFSIPILGYIYGPVSTIPGAKIAVRIFFFPFVVISGLWLWKGHQVKNYIKRKWGRNKVAAG